MAEGKIYKAIAGVMKDVGAVGKDSKNPQQGYKYRGIDAVMNALQPAMVKHGIFAAPAVIASEREERQTQRGSLLIYSMLTVKYTFYAEDGSFVETTVVGEGMDSGDKSSNKAMSAAFKYACFQTFCIPTEEMIDSEVDSPEPAPKPKKKAEPKKISAKHAEEIKGILEETDSNVPAFLSLFRAESVDSMYESQYEDAMAKLEQKRQMMKGDK